MTMDMSRPVLIHGLSRDVYQDIKNKTTGTSSGARTAYPSGAPEFTPVEIRVAAYPSGAPEFTPVGIGVAPYPSGAPVLYCGTSVICLLTMFCIVVLQ